MVEVEWRKLRADELRDATTRDAIVIVPIAALEQHGPHLPVETDWLVARRCRAAWRASAPGRQQR